MFTWYMEIYLCHNARMRNDEFAKNLLRHYTNFANYARPRIHDLVEIVQKGKM